MSSSYLTTADADALAATLPALAAWSAAITAVKATALEQASLDVDNAMPYQGRKYDAEQVNQFPRVPYDATEELWDRDPATEEAVVPEDVLIAVLYQADAALAGEREARLAAQHDGVVYDQTGSVAESYKKNDGPGVTTGLCRAAWVLLRKYRIKSGQVL